MLLAGDQWCCETLENQLTKREYIFHHPFQILKKEVYEKFPFYKINKKNTRFLGRERLFELSVYLKKFKNSEAFIRGGLYMKNYGNSNEFNEFL